MFAHPFKLRLVRGRHFIVSKFSRLLLKELLVLKENLRTLRNSGSYKGINM